jgi:hypothetical protein
MAELLWRIFGGGGGVLLGCWIYLRPRIVFGDWHESPKVFTFLRAWALCIIFGGLFLFFSVICLVFSDYGILGLICGLSSFAGAGLGTWYLRKRLLRRVTPIYPQSIGETHPSHQ